MPEPDELPVEIEVFELETERDGSYELARLRVAELLGHDVRPWALVQAVVRAS